MYCKWVLRLTALLLVLLLAACSSTPAEQQVRDAIAAAVSAAEVTDAGAFGKVLSEDFDGNQGQFDRRRLLGMLRVQRLRGNRVGVLAGPVSTEWRGERLLATFTVTLRGGRGVLPDELGVYRVVTGWREVDGDWRCYSASWKRAL